MKTEKSDGVFSKGLKGSEYHVMYGIIGPYKESEAEVRNILRSEEEKSIWILSCTISSDGKPPGLYALVQKYEDNPFFRKETISKLEELCSELICYDATD